MIVRIPVTKTYEVELNSADTADAKAVQSAKWRVRDLSAEQIEQEGNLIDTATGQAEILGLDYSQETPCTD